MYSIIQVIALIFALIAIGHAISKEVTKFDKVLGFLFCFIFMCFVLFIQGVMK